MRERNRIDKMIHTRGKKAKTKCERNKKDMRQDDRETEEMRQNESETREETSSAHRSCKQGRQDCNQHQMIGSPKWPRVDRKSERKECANTREREREERNPPFPQLDLQKEQASPCSQEPHGCRRSLLKSPPENVWDHGPNGTSRAKGAVWACLCVCLRRRGPTLHLCQTERNRESERMSPFQPNHRATESGSGCSPTD